MPKVIIDGIEYVPKAEIPTLTDKNLENCLKVLTSMRYFKQNHKMQSLAYDAIYALSPELAELEPEIAFERIHGVED